MQTIQNSAFKEKAAPVEDVSKLLPEVGSVVLNKRDGRLYAADKFGWHKFGEPYSPIPLLVDYDGVTQFKFQFRAPATSTLIIHDGDGTVTDVAGQDDTQVSHTTNYATAGQYYFFVVGDWADITSIRIANQVPAVGTMEGLSALPNLVSLILIDTAITGSFELLGETAFTTFTLADSPHITGDVSRLSHLECGITIRGCPGVTFESPAAFPATTGLRHILRNNDWETKYVDNAVKSFKGMQDGKIILTRNAARSYISDEALIEMVSGGNQVCIRENKSVGELGPELCVDANAVSDPNGNEADALTGWVQTGLGAPNEFISQSQIKAVGSFAFKANANPQPTSGAEIQLSPPLAVVADDIYVSSFNLRHMGEGVASWLHFLNGADTQIVVTPDHTDFNMDSVYFTSPGTTFDTEFRENGTSNDGGVYVDSFSLRKVTLP